MKNPKKKVYCIYAVITFSTFIIEFYLSVIKVKTTQRKHEKTTLTKSPYLLLLEIAHDFEPSPKGNEQRVVSLTLKVGR